MKWLTRLLVLFLSLNSYAGKDISMQVNKNQPSFVVSLDANPTTGFQWSVQQFDQSFLTLSQSKYQKSQTHLIGAGGKMQFTFTLNKGKSYPDNTKITFQYARAWEKEGGMVKTVTIHFIDKD